MYGIEITSCYNTAIHITFGLLPSTRGVTVYVKVGVLPFRHYTASAICRKVTGFLKKTAGVLLLVEPIQRFRSLANQVLDRVSGLIGVELSVGTS